MTYTITNNAQFNSIEITFDGKPSAAVRDALKAIKFRWHGVKKVWYGYTTEAAARAAIESAGDAEAAEPVKKKAPAVNVHGVKVGDLFYTSWGYEQTNVDFFQVVELVGSSSVRVREVCPEMVEEDAVSGMSANRRYKVPENGELLPPSTRSTFIADNERGDLRRVVNRGYGVAFKVGKPNCYQETAQPYDGGFLYESWYY